MNFTPIDLQNLNFKKVVLGGLSEDAVKDLMQKIVEDYNRFVRENIELKDKITVLNDGIKQYKTLEESLQNTLVVAQQTSEELKKSAYQKAENIIREAELKAQKYIDEANKEVLKITFEYEEVKKRLHIFKAKSETLLISQLEVLKQMLDDGG